MFIGLQIRPILAALDPDVRMQYLRFAGLILLTVITARICWVLLHNGVVLWKNRVFGHRPKRAGQPPPTFSGGLVISWAGMRGIITLAAALALPDGPGAEFPYRDLIVLTAFAVVFGTLVVQGLTLKPLIRLLRLEDDDPVGREVDAARGRALEAALSAVGKDRSPAAEAVRLELSAHLGGHGASDGEGGRGRRVARGRPPTRPRGGAAHRHRDAGPGRNRRRRLPPAGGGARPGGGGDRFGLNAPVGLRFDSGIRRS